MVVLSFVILGFMMYLMLPLITSKLAVRLGRDPKKWFIIGFLLPAIATLILFCLPERKN
jgi:hypothetical protein